MSEQTAIAPKTPCWLTSEQKEQAQALIELGFCYCGTVDDFEQWEDMKCLTSGDWHFYTVAGECLLDAVCQGAVYSWCLETHPKFDEENFFDDRLKEIRATLRRVRSRQKKQRDEQFKQLRLAV